MKLNKVYSFFIPLVFTLFITSCKNTELAVKNNLKTMPENYNSLKDSVNSANIKWKLFFNDTNLIELIDEALKNNFDLLIALQKIEADKSNILSKKGALFPSVSIGASAAQRKFGLYTMDGAGNISTTITPEQYVPIHLPDYYTSLQSNWEIDIWGKLRNKKKAALSRYLASVEGKNFIITNLISEVAKSYYELLALDNELDIIEETTLLQQNALNLISVQKEAATATELAVKQFEAQLLNSKALELEILQNIIVCENKINFLLGRYPQKIKRNKSLFNKNISIQVSVGSPADLLKNRPDIKQAEFELIAAKADVKAAKAAFYPSLNITGAAGFQSFRTALLFSTPESIAYTIFGGIAGPLLNRSVLQAELKSSKAGQQEAFLNYQKCIINAYAEVVNQLSSIRNMDKIYELKKQEVKVLSVAIENAIDLFKSGRATYIEVLMTQKGSLDSKLDMINARQRQFNSMVTIYKALGGGWQ